MAGLLMLSVIAIAYLLLPNINQLRESNFSIDTLNLFLVGFLMLCLLYLKATVHAVILEKYDLKSTSRMHIITSYANGQVVRYIPGKILGIVSQSLKLGEVAKASYVWEANFSQYIITNLVSALLILSFAGYTYFESIFFPVFFVVTSLLSTFVLTSKATTKFFDFVSSTLSITSISTGHHCLSMKQAMSVMILLYIEWFFYFSAWYFLVDGSLGVSLYIGTLYAASSLLALLAFVVPNGLLVREAIFLWLGTLANIAAEELIFYGIVIRVFYIVCDLLFYFICEMVWKLAAWSKK